MKGFIFTVLLLIGIFVQTVQGQVTCQPLLGCFNMTDTTLNYCGGTFKDSGDGGLMGLTGGYGNDEDYTMTICSDNGDPLFFSFDDLDIKSGDHLVIYDGNSTGAPQLYDISNQSLDLAFISSGTCITFHFTSNNAGMLGTNGSFSASFDCVTPVPISDEGTKTGCDFLLTDSNPSGAYGPNEDYTITMCPATADGCITVGMSGFDIADDVLEVYDGDDVSGVPLISLTGTDQIGDIKSSKGSCLTFHFTSNGSNQGSGWLGGVSCPSSCIPPCDPNSPAAGDDCADATPICDLNGYCGSTLNCDNDPNGYSPDWPGDFCANGGSNNCGITYSSCSSGLFSGSIENNSWLKFVANDVEAAINVYVYSCQNGNAIQIGIYEATNCDNFSLVSEYNYTSGGISADQVNLVTATGLTPGQTYYIMIDGNGGAYCQYTVEAVSGIYVGPQITDDQIICEGQTAIIDVTGVPGGGTVNWLAGYSGSETHLTEIPANTTQYTVHVQAVSGFCTYDDTLTTTVTVIPSDSSVCQPDYTCDVTASVSQATICEGESTDISAEGDVNVALMANTFDDQTVGIGWQGGTTANLDNPTCAGNLPYGTTFLWMDDQAPAPRNLTTSNFDLTNGGTISFWMKFAVQGDLAPCEGPDMAGEGVSLQYSIDGGSTWQDITYFSPDGNEYASNPDFAVACDQNNQVVSGGATNFTTWARYSYSIPVPAQTNNTRFRWYQICSTQNDTDNWGIDSVMIVTPPDAITITWTSNPVDPNLNTAAQPYDPNAGNPITETVSPTQDTWYIAEISDGTFSCIDSVFVEVNPIPVANFSVPDSVCVDDSLGTFTFTGTAGPTATYNWTFTDGTPATQTGVGPHQVAWNGGAGALGPKNITLQVTDEGCTHDTTLSTEIVQCICYTPPTIIDVTPAPCHDSPVIFEYAGTANVGSSTFNWDFGTGTVVSGNVNGPGPINVTFPTPGQSYNVSLEVIEAPCEPADTTISIDIPTELTVSLSNINDEFCGQCNGTANASASGGTPNYTYSWNTNPDPGIANHSALCQGTHTVTVTDAEGCTATADATINTVPGPTITTNAYDENCGLCDGSTAVSVTGGTGNMTYNWVNTSTMQTVSVLDSAYNLCAGTYEITVTDAEGCTDNTTATVNTIQGITDATITTTDDYCGLCTGEAEVTNVTGGTGPYTYLWQNISQTSSTATGLCYGPYTVEIIDANGCSFTKSVTIDSIPGFFVNSSSVADKCGQCVGSATINLSGGDAPFVYTWDGIAGAPIPQTTNTKTDLCAGNHTVRVEDNTGCSQQITITVDEIPGPDVSITNSQDITCNGLDNGRAWAQGSTGGSGGSTSFVYEWDNNPGMVGSPINNLTPGQHKVVVTDGNGCKDSATVMINEPNELIATITDSENPRCTGDNNGSATVSVTGGTPQTGNTYSVNWSPSGGTMVTGTNMGAGFYTVTVTDANGCQDQDTITLIDPPVLTCSITDTTKEICENGQNGTATAAAQGGTPGYTYNWIPGSIPGQQATGLTGGTYTVTVTDANGCQCNSSVVITTQVAPTFQPIKFDDRCEYCEGEISSSTPVGGNGGPYTYLWLNADGDTIASSESVSGVCAGTYRLIVSDGECSRMLPVSVENHGGITAQANASPTTVNILDPEVHFYNNSEGEPADSCYWDFGDGNYSFTCNPAHNYEHSGVYDVVLIVEDEYGCLDTTTISVEVNDIYTFYIPNSFTPNGDGKNEMFGPKGANIDEAEYEFRIFDRWGKQVYYTTDPFEYWNGRVDNIKEVCPQGVYVYRIVLKDVFGVPYEYFGKVTIVK